MLVYRFESRNPFENLAREELLFEALGPGQEALVLYVNAPCVVLGKHQNPLREVKLDEWARRRVPLVRRSSGGGTVWHDEGNLNWSYLGPRVSYDRQAVSDRVVAALASLGRSVVAGDKEDLFYEGKKVSGAAYWLQRDKVLHHGTLLCRARLDDLKGVLGPSGRLVEWVGVASRPSPVTNLDLDVERVSDALAASFGGRDQALPWADVAGRVAGLSSAAWVWDQTPPFTWEGETRVGSGQFRVEAGRVVRLDLVGDPDPGRWTGRRFFAPPFFDGCPAPV